MNDIEPSIASGSARSGADHTDRPNAAHRGGTFDRLFQRDRLSVGIFVSIQPYPDGDIPDMSEHAALARLAEEAGFGALWLRDVPFRDPAFGDAGQVYDPFVYAGWLAAATSRIAIGTAGIVLPLRDPIIVAKQAASVDQLSAGRFILGLSSGDRATEYPAFGLDFQNRAERYRDAATIIRTATTQAFPVHLSRHYGELSGNLDLLPKPVAGSLPMLAIGRSGQDIEWLAGNMDGWLWHQTDFARLPGVIASWREAVGAGVFKPYGYGHWLDLLADPAAPLEVGRGIRTGRDALIRLWRHQRVEGVDHVAINLKISRRPAREVIDEFATHILPRLVA